MAQETPIGLASTYDRGAQCLAIPCTGLMEHTPCLLAGEVMRRRALPCDVATMCCLCKES